jgi:His/Glu/Gln/Arg/opine family amino acid ABC transporter permease subunit
MDFGFVLEQLPALLQATWITVQLTVWTLVVSTLAALPLAVLRMQEGTIAARVVGWYSALMRAIPTLVVLFFAYYALPQLGIVLPAFETALAGLALSATAYNLEIFRAGFKAVSPGQFEAARALGVPGWRIWWSVAVPQALPVIVPTYLSNATLVLKGTSVASIITISELTAVANEIVSTTYRPFEVLVTAAVLYVAMGGILSLLAALVARKWATR